jgi:hypothetical protein
MIIESIAGILIVLLLGMLFVEYRRRAKGFVPLSNDVSIYNGVFWDLWTQKMFRNVASMKYQILLMLYAVTVYGMFFAEDDRLISTTAGLAFLAGGFITMATSRIIANTSLLERKKRDGLDTDM